MVAERVNSPVPAYVSYRTFRNFVDGLRVAMPARIDRSVMGTMSGATRSQLLATLKYLHLVSTTGNPTERLIRLVNSDGSERQKALRDVLTSAYSFLFDKSFDLQKSTTHQLEEKFGSTGASGQTIRKCVAFFVASAKDADLLLSPYIKPTRASRGSRAKGSRIQIVGAFQDDSGGNARQNPAESPTLVWPQLLLSKFPKFDPAWPDEVKSRWFEAFEQLMSMCGSRETKITKRLTRKP